MLNTEKEIIEYCEENACQIKDIVLEEEKNTFKLSEAKVRDRLSKMIEVMEESAKANLKKESKTRFGMIDGFAKKSHEYSKKREPILGKFVMEAMAMAFSTSEINCDMGRIVATPTAGSSGIMPSIIVSAKKRYKLDEESVQNGLLTASGIGQIIAKYASFAGASAGCQAECGSAAAMGAACLVSMLGGDTSMCLNAASIAIINVLGLVCDPIAGLVQYPCTFRNASGVVNAFIAADLAMAGIKSIVPFEEVVIALKDVGDLMDESLRETGLGGLAGSKVGQKIRSEFLKDE